MNKVIQIMLVALSLQQVNAQSKDPSLLDTFVANGESLSLCNGVSFDVITDFVVTDAMVKHQGEEHIRKYKIVSSHAIDLNKYYVAQSYEPKDKMPDIAEYAWNGDSAYQFDTQPSGMGTIQLSQHNTSQIFAMMATEGLLFPYKLFYSPSEQTMMLSPTPDTLSQMVKMDKIKPLITELSFERDASNKISIVRDMDEKGVYKLTFDNANLKFPEIIEHKDTTTGELTESRVTEWLDLSQCDQLVNSRFPQKIETILKTAEGVKLVTKTTAINNFKWGQSFETDKFVIDRSKARYFVDTDKHLQIDTKTNEGKKLLKIEE